MPTYRNDDNTPYLMQDTAGDTRAVAPGETIQTHKVYGYPGLTKISDEPYFPLALSVHDLTFAGAGIKSVSGFLEAKVVRISTDVELSITANEAVNPYSYTLAADKEVDIKNSSEIESLYLTSTGSGTARVIALAE